MVTTWGGQLNEHDQRFIQQWGEAIYETQQRGLSLAIHHDDYPRWTCRLWRDMPGDKLEVIAQAYAPYDALRKALTILKEEHT